MAFMLLLLLSFSCVAGSGVDAVDDVAVSGAVCCILCKPGAWLFWLCRLVCTRWIGLIFFLCTSIYIYVCTYRTWLYVFTTHFLMSRTLRYPRSGAVLKIEVWDWDRSSADDPLGHFEVNIGEELLSQQVDWVEQPACVSSSALMLYRGLRGPIGWHISCISDQLSFRGSSYTWCLRAASHERLMRCCAFLKFMRRREMRLDQISLFFFNIFYFPPDFPPNSHVVYFDFECGLFWFWVWFSCSCSCSCTGSCSCPCSCSLLFSFPFSPSFFSYP